MLLGFPGNEYGLGSQTNHSWLDELRNQAIKTHLIDQILIGWPGPASTPSGRSDQPPNRVWRISAIGEPPRKVREIPRTSFASILSECVLNLACGINLEFILSDNGQVTLV